MRTLFRTLLAGSLAAAALAQTVTFSLTSPQDGTSVTGGSTVHWTAGFVTSTGDNQGAALVVTDLVQHPANPALFDIPPAAAPVPAGMTNFARPAGVTNPGDVVAANGYYGVQRGTAGQRNLIQIGGMQNTFGVSQNPGAGMAEVANPLAGVGQAGMQVLASGSFTAPNTPGLYSFSLQNGIANVLVQRNDAPAISPVAPATAVMTGALFSFTVTPCLPGDANCDGSVNNFDIDYFVDALLSNGDPTAYLARGGSQACFDARDCWGDLDGSTALNNFDIDAFVACIISPPAPGQPCP
ncbi:MAG: hypothetical protein HRU75_12790 [Planctomycetia bacterium]|nr:MAG: hypothetical protein HRU75_12790 [Planctomycetia bacterium]